MSSLRTLKKNILFKFEDELVTAGGIKQFKEITKSGLILAVNFDKNVKSSRWGIVVAVGPEVVDPDLVVGSRVLIEPLKWTEGVDYEGETYWMTNEDHVLLIDES